MALSRVFFVGAVIDEFDTVYLEVFETDKIDENDDLAMQIQKCLTIICRYQGKFYVLFFS